MKTLSYTLFIFIFFVITLSTDPVRAGTATLTWDPNTEADLSGYRVYHGTESGNYSTIIDAGNVTEYTVNGLDDGKTYFFAVTAYDTSGNVSGYSNEVSKLIGASSGGGSSDSGVSGGSGGGCGTIRNITDRPDSSPVQVILNLIVITFMIFLGKLQVQLRKQLGKRLLY
jgi:hypothetical protein